jgi:hypothetical protein
MGKLYPLQPKRIGYNIALTEKYLVENKLFNRLNTGGINRAEMADFLIKQAEKQTELKK